MLLYQPSEGYCYNSDSIFLYDFVSSFKPRGRMLDVGAGCGVVGLLVARDNPKVALEAVEKQDAFVQYASKNAEVNGIGYRIHHTDFLAFDDEKGFDYIVSNPPFYHEGASRSNDEMVHTARYNIHLPIDAFISHAARLLRPQGHLVLCYDPQQFAHLCAACERAKLRVVDVQFLHSKPDRNATLVLLHARKNSRSLMKVRPPIFAFDEDEFSAKSQQVYRDARTHSIKCTL
ncbi:MAG: methyltransferase [Campylobacterales bacterium]|jgi:tRNA1(Val) A37 N6-methylase TrmN6